MSVVARRIRSTPERTSLDTWTVIVNLVAPGDSEATAELQSVAGVAASLIADEVPEGTPIVVAGTGPRLRIYCLYGDDAVTGTNSNEAALSWIPTAGAWTMWLPCPSEDLDWVRRELASSSHLVAYDAALEEPGDSAQASLDRQSAITINTEAFRKP